MQIIRKTAIVFILLVCVLSMWSCSGGAEILVYEEPNPTPTPLVSKEPLPTQAAAPSPTPAPTPEPTPEPTPQLLTLEDKVEYMIQTMTPDEKLGQLVMFGFNGQTMPPQGFIDNFQKYKCGGIMLYGWNVSTFSQVAKLLDNVNQLNPNPNLPLFTGIDVEGGTVSRFKWTPYVSTAKRMGQRNDPEYTYNQFRFVGEKLKETGLNVDFAPVLDIAKNPDETFLGSRIYGSNPDKVIPLTNAVINGLHDGGAMVCVGKHFPGHGSTNEDSHQRTPEVYKDIYELKDYDLIPFQAAIDNGLDAMLVAHISYPAIDPKDVASVSSVIIQDLLRNEMGFEGIVFSDDMRMRGITSKYKVEESAVKFILAGGDIILCGPHYDKQQRIMEALTEAYANGTITEERLNTSIRRILLKKLLIEQ